MKKKHNKLAQTTIQKMSEARASWWARQKLPAWKKAVVFAREIPSQLKEVIQMRHNYKRKLEAKYEKTIHFIRTF